MSSRKTRFSLWINGDVLERVKEEYAGENCKTQSEFIEKAIEFYLSHLAADKTDAYLPVATASVIEGTLTGFENRISKLLFKLSVEQAMMMNIIAYDTDIDQVQLDRLRGKCVSDVKRTNGQISFKDVLKYQKTV